MKIIKIFLYSPLDPKYFYSDIISDGEVLREEDIDESTREIYVMFKGNLYIFYEAGDPHSIYTFSPDIVVFETNTAESSYPMNEGIQFLDHYLHNNIPGIKIIFVIGEEVNLPRSFKYVNNGEDILNL